MELEQRYIFYKMIDPQKNVSIVMNKDNNKLYVQKEYSVYNRKVFEKLKEMHFTGVPIIYECVEENNKLYTVEEYIRGTDLLRRFNEHGIFKEKDVLEISIQLCDILKKLHALNPPIIHRDIKPSNIMIRKNGSLVLIDFNATKEYQDGVNEDTVLFGTRYFAAPEQLTGYGQSDIRTDIYGIGATMNYLMTGMAVNQMIIPGVFHDIWQKCTRMDQSDRYGSIEALERDLLRVQL